MNRILRTDTTSRIPDLVLTGQHPKRAFMRRALEFEIRLSYHDRILKTLPPVMQEEDANVIAAQAPGPDFDYEEPSMFQVLALSALLILTPHYHIIIIYSQHIP